MFEISEPRYCCQCGGALFKPPGEVHPRCPSCGKRNYLDPKLAACALISTPEGVVMTRRSKGRPGAGLWDIPGGFVDRGETPGEAAVREALEESGLVVEVGHLVGVFSYTGHPVVVIVFQAGVVSGNLTAGREVDQVRVFAPDQLPWDELAFESTADALKKYLANSGQEC